MYVNYTIIGCAKRAWKPTERAPDGQIWKKLGQQLNKVILDHNPKNNIYIHDFMLISIDD